MIPPEVEIVTATALLLFALGLAFGAGSTIARMLRFRSRRIPQPRLIWRDVGVFGLLALAFLLIAINRALGWQFTFHLWWVVFTSVIAVAAIGIYDYYEIFVVGRVREKTDRDSRDMTQDESEDLQFGTVRRALEVEHNEEDVREP